MVQLKKEISWDGGLAGSSTGNNDLRELQSGFGATPTSPHPEEVHMAEDGVGKRDLAPEFQAEICAPAQDADYRPGCAGNG